MFPVEFYRNVDVTVSGRRQNVHRIKRYKAMQTVQLFLSLHLTMDEGGVTDSAASLSQSASESSKNVYTPRQLLSVETVYVETEGRVRLRSHPVLSAKLKAKLKKRSYAK
jgi:hypothetical protein